MKATSVSSAIALALMAGVFASPASAADLGGNCCADLEERIADLEATTARKGNRKVSLTISGWVAEQVTWFDDGQESNVYVSGIGTTLSSHFKMTGEAKIMPGWSAGYVLHVEVNSNDPFFLSQNNDDSGIINTADLGTGVRALQSYWFLKSDQLGKISVGRLSQASDNTAILVDGSGSLVPANWVLFDGQAFNLVNKPGAALVVADTWGNLFGFCGQSGLPIGSDCTGVPSNVVRYDSPTFAGFSVSASWGEDDLWDVAARYAGEFSGIKLAVAAAYSHVSDEAYVVGGAAGDHKDVDYFQIGAYVQHVPTGLFLYGAYGQEYIDSTNGAGVKLAAGNDSPDHWYIKAGIRQRWNSLGHTVLYGEYGQHNDMSELAILNAGVSTELKRWGLGAVQEIDAAAMSLWIKYRHYEADISFGGVGLVGLEDFDTVIVGALINF
jgi:predicted porin